MKALWVLFGSMSLFSCAGYQLGGAKPAAMSEVRNISVSMFVNDTQHVRAEALATSAVTGALTTDGTYRLSSLDSSDAVLEGSVRKIEYSSIRGSRLDTLLPEELSNTVTLQWSVKDAKNPTRVLASGESTGTSQLFVDSNLQTARHNALVDALERASEALVSRLASGY